VVALAASLVGLSGCVAVFGWVKEELANT